MVQIPYELNHESYPFTMELSTTHAFERLPTAVQQAKPLVSALLMNSSQFEPFLVSQGESALQAKEKRRFTGSLKSRCSI